MNKKTIWLLTGIIGIFMMISCGQKTKVYQNVDEWVAEVESTVEKITVQDLHAWLDTGAILIVDIREANEYNPGFIPGSVNIPRGVVEFNIANDKFWEDQFLYPPVKTDPLVIVCKKGSRSILTVDALKKMGFTNIKVLDGGFKNWELTFPGEQDKNLEQVHAGGEKGGC